MTRKKEFNEQKLDSYSAKERGFYKNIILLLKIGSLSNTILKLLI
jgi:hypothetical protein